MIMIKVCLRVVLTIYCVIICLSCQKRNTELQASSYPISVKTNNLHLGKIGMNSIRYIDFQLKNVSNKSVIIKNVRSSCNCTSYVLQKKELQPNEVTTFTVQYFTGIKLGFRDSKLLLELNSPDNNACIVHFDSDMHKIFDLTSDEILMDSGFSSLKKEFVISSSPQDGGFDISKIEMPKYVNCKQIVESVTRRRLIFSCDSDLPLGFYESSIKIYTTNKEQQNIYLPLSVTIRGAFLAEPSQAFVYSKKDGQGGELLIKITRLDGQSFFISKVVTQSNEIKVNYDSEKRSSHMLTVKYKKDKPEINDILEVYGLGKYERIKVPIGITNF